MKVKCLWLIEDMRGLKTYKRGEFFQKTKKLLIRPESIMPQNLPIMVFGTFLIFCLLCLFLCFLDMDYADISCFLIAKIYRK